MLSCKKDNGNGFIKHVNIEMSSFLVSFNKPYSCNYFCLLFDLKLTHFQDVDVDLEKDR